MNDKFHIEIDCQQKNHEGERICGDVFISRKIKEENRIIAVLSDGMGHGVKANILATLTSTMAVNFTSEHKEMEKIAEIIMNTLPVCSERKISYSTFTIIDIDTKGKTSILEYDNPNAIILRGNKLYEFNWENIILKGEKNQGKKLRFYSFYAQKEDRIIFSSDGITQSGLGSRLYPFGWGHDNLESYVLKLVNNNPKIAGSHLGLKVVNMAHKNDNYTAKDDTSCGVIYFREPRKLLICTGPPYEKENDKVYADKLSNFDGKKILCGATTSDIISREWNEKIVDSFEFEDPDLPPTSQMKGIDLITEGILTLSKVSKLIDKYGPNTQLGRGPADLIVKMILESDEINMVIGTRINIAHQDPNLPIDLEIRRTVVKRIARTLEDKFLKEVKVEFI
ncbi:MAG: SpoIIE family protein phosphatase [Bacteroidales bacterium]|nr:SpoIIE family protein phosphatase [Bacteroidales bacterium]